MPTQIVTDAVAGPFRASYTGPAGSPSIQHLGVIGSRGIRQIRRYEGEEYAADLAGSSIVEGVYLGGQVFLEFELEEANLNAVKGLMNPFRAATDHPTADVGNEMGIPGTFMTSKAGAITLNPLYTSSGNLHTTAGAQTTPIRTYGLVTIAAGFEREELLSSRRKVIPMRLRCFPYSDGGSPAKYIWYGLTAIDGTYRID